jgi:hypothetical protein
MRPNQNDRYYTQDNGNGGYGYSDPYSAGYGTTGAKPPARGRVQYETNNN